MDTPPVLRIRAKGPLDSDVTELSLGGVDLIPFHVIDVRIDLKSDHISRATMTFEITPDVELPAEIEAYVVKPRLNVPEPEDKCETCGHAATRHDGRVSRCLECDAEQSEHRFKLHGLQY
jgi:hypothetical protein